MAQTTEVSVVLPCFGAASLANRSVHELRRALTAAFGGAWEIIVVDDGGGDFPPGPPWDDEAVRLLRLPVNRGKGAAVAAGMKAAGGRVRIYTDVDLPYGSHLIPVIVQYLARHPFHVVIGDRTLSSSSYHQKIDWKRRAASRLYSRFVGRLVTGGFFDTQCGLKGFRGDVADHLFGLLRVERFAFDVELIYVSLIHRLDIKRIPVRLRRNETSSVRLTRDAIRGFVDTFRIKYNQVLGRYDCPELDELVDRDFDRLRGDVDRPFLDGTADSPA